MWVRLKKESKNIEVRGRMRRFHPGDWVEVGKQTALLWLAKGTAIVPNLRVKDFAAAGDAGVLVTNHFDVGKSRLADLGGELAVQFGEPRLPWDVTFLWDPEVPLQERYVPVGLSLLDVWEVAVPLLPYETLARDLSDEADRDRTRALIHDLRVPLYDDRFMFVRRTPNTETLMEFWQQERVDGPDRRLSLLRAVYRAKPFVLALPCTWTTPKAVADDD